MQRIVEIQNKLKAPKNNHNDFGGFNYRSAEDILEALKPLLKEQGLCMILTDDVFTTENGWVYIKATVSIYDVEDVTKPIATNTAFARESETKKGADKSQITGACSSYARKYALGGMFLLDDQKDADTNEFHKQTHKRIGKSTIVAKIKDAGIKDVEKLYGQYGVKTYEELSDEQTNDLDDKLTKQIEMVKANEK